MFKYLVYFSVTTLTSVECPDRLIAGMGYIAEECNLEHVKEVTDSFKTEFQHKRNAVAYYRLAQARYKNVELDSVKSD